MKGVRYRLHAANHSHGQGRCVTQAGLILCGLLRDVRWGGAGAEARGSHQYRIHSPGERHRVWRPVPVAAPEQGIAVPGTTPGQVGEKLRSLYTTNVLKQRNIVTKKVHV